VLAVLGAELGDGRLYGGLVKGSPILKSFLGQKEAVDCARLRGLPDVAPFFKFVDVEKIRVREETLEFRVDELFRKYFTVDENRHSKLLWLGDVQKYVHVSESPIKHDDVVEIFLPVELADHHPYWTRARAPQILNGVEISISCVRHDLDKVVTFG
jgi:hypothetical protein